jgi:hypothetical protein
MTAVAALRLEQGFRCHCSALQAGAGASSAGAAQSGTQILGYSVLSQGLHAARASTAGHTESGTECIRVSARRTKPERAAQGSATGANPV